MPGPQLLDRRSCLCSQEQHKSSTLINNRNLSLCSPLNGAITEFDLNFLLRRNTPFRHSLRDSTSSRLALLVCTTVRTDAERSARLLDITTGVPNPLVLRRTNVAPPFNLFPQPLIRAAVHHGSRKKA